MRAARILKRDFGYETRVINMHTLKPSMRMRSRAQPRTAS